MSDQATQQTAEIDLTKTNDPSADQAELNPETPIDVPVPAPSHAPEGPANGEPDGPDGDRVIALEGQPNYLPGQVDPKGFS